MNLNKWLNLNKLLKLNKWLNLNKWLKLNNLEKIIIIFIVIIISILIKNLFKIKVENFTSKDRKFILKKNNEIYDDFYVNVYDDLVYSDVKNNYEIGIIVNKTKPTKASYILDVGSGTGHHVGKLCNMGYKTIGIDISPSMIKKSKKNYPNCKFVNNDMLQTINFHQNTFTHISCLYFTIYYINNKKQFFDNCMYWLMPGGYLILHLVNKYKFDPILPISNPLAIINPQNYTSKRITSSVAKFENYDYKSDFVLKDNNVIFNETFKNKKNGNVIKNELDLHIDKQSHILGLAKKSGFILLSTNDMAKCNYESQYIYILQKPN